MSKPTLQLYDTIGLGIIFCYKSGVIYSNQTGGTSNMDPTMEGVYLPMRNDYLLVPKEFVSPENELTKYFIGHPHRGTGATNGISEEDAQQIEKILSEYRLHPIISVDRDKLKDSHEAWIFVTIKGDELQNTDLSAWADFNNYPIKAILTWCNSD